MAAYAATVTSLMKRAVKVDNITGIGMFAGSCNVTNYNTTLGAIAAIRDKFRSGGVISVVAGTSDNGNIFEWVNASSSFKVYRFDYDAVADGSAIEHINDQDAGAVDFVAYGLV